MLLFFLLSSCPCVLILMPFQGIGRFIESRQAQQVAPGLAASVAATLPGRCNLAANDTDTDALDTAGLLSQVDFNGLKFRILWQQRKMIATAVAF